MDRTVVIKRAAIRTTVTGKVALDEAVLGLETSTGLRDGR